MKRFIVYPLSILLLLSCQNQIDLEFTKSQIDLPEEASPSAPVGPPIDLSTSSVLWATSNPYYTMLGQPDQGGRANDLWISDGTEAGSIVLKVNPDDGRRISNCNPQDINNFDGGPSILGNRYDLDNDGDFDNVELLVVNADFSYTLLATINEKQADQDIFCYYSSMTNGVKIFYIGSSNGNSDYREMWRTDGTVGGTYVLGGGNNGGYGTHINNGPYRLGNHVYFVVENGNGSSNPSLVRTNGTNFERVNIPGKPYPWNEFVTIRTVNDDIYIWFQTSHIIAHVKPDESIAVYTGGAGSHSNVNFYRDNYFSKNHQYILLESNNVGVFPHQYLNTVTGEYYPVTGDLLNSVNVPFMVSDTGFYFYEDLGGGNYQIKKSTDANTFTILGTVNLDSAPADWWSKFLDRYLVYEINNEQIIFDVENAIVYSPTFVSNCAEGDFSRIIQMGTKSTHRDTDHIYYACTQAPNAAFAKYNLTTHTTDVFVEVNMMTEMSTETKAMTFVHTFLMNYLNVLAFYNINDGQVIGATPFN